MTTTIAKCLKVKDQTQKTAEVGLTPRLVSLVIVRQGGAVCAFPVAEALLAQFVSRLPPPRRRPLPVVVSRDDQATRAHRQ